MNSNIPTYWDGERWIVNSVSPLSPSQLQRISLWIIKVQSQRRIGLIAGQRRDDLDVSIKALKTGKIICGLSPQYSGPDGREFIPFKATESTGKIISLGSV